MPSKRLLTAQSQRAGLDAILALLAEKEARLYDFLLAGLQTIAARAGRQKVRTPTPSTKGTSAQQQLVFNRRR